MKQLIPGSALLLTLLASLTFPACSDAPQGDQAKISDQKKGSDVFSKSCGPTC